MNDETDTEVNVDDSAVDDLFGEDEAGEAGAVVAASETETTAGDTDATGEAQASEQGTEEQASTETAEPDKEEPTSVPIAAIHDERRKSQALREENERLKAQLPKDETGAPDMYEDPDGYKQWVKDQFATELYQERVSDSRAKMLEEHADYESVEKTFMMLAGQDESLVDKMKAHPEPARFAYDTAVAHKESQRQSLKNELRAEMLAETGKAGDTETKELTEAEKRNESAINTPNLTTAAATDKNTVQVEEDDESLDEMCSDMKY